MKSLRQLFATFSRKIRTKIPKLGSGAAQDLIVIDFCKMFDEFSLFLVSSQAASPPAKAWCDEHNSRVFKTILLPPTFEHPEVNAALLCEGCSNIPYT